MLLQMHMHTRVRVRTLAHTEDLPPHLLLTTKVDDDDDDGDADDDADEVGNCAGSAAAFALDCQGRDVAAAGACA